jgi:hypothetical protein
MNGTKEHRQPLVRSPEFSEFYDVPLISPIAERKKTKSSFNWPGLKSSLYDTFDLHAPVTYEPGVPPKVKSKVRTGCLCM